VTKENKVTIDLVDQKILAALQENGRLTFAELGRRVVLSTPAVSERVRRLEEKGVIRGYHAEVDLAKLGYPMVAFLRIAVSGDALARVPALCQSMPQVLECHRITGADSFIMKLVTSSVEELQNLIDRFTPYVHTNTALVLSSHVGRHNIGLWDANGPKSTRKEKPIANLAAPARLRREAKR
jgi:Lrp/AsnC family leucine-responsive transcriptional regulator